MNPLRQLTRQAIHSGLQSLGRFTQQADSARFTQQADSGVHSARFTQQADSARFTQQAVTRTLHSAG